GQLTRPEAIAFHVADRAQTPPRREAILPHHPASACGIRPDTDRVVPHCLRAARWGNPPGSNDSTRSRDRTGIPRAGSPESYSLAGSDKGSGLAHPPPPHTRSPGLAPPVADTLTRPPA